MRVVLWIATVALGFVGAAGMSSMGSAEHWWAVLARIVLFVAAVCALFAMLETDAKKPPPIRR